MTAIISASTAPSSGTFTVPKGNWMISVRGSIGGAGNAGLKMLVDAVEDTNQTITWYAFTSAAPTNLYNVTFALSLNAAAAVKFQLLAPAGANILDQVLVFSALC